MSDSVKNFNASGKTVHKRHKNYRNRVTTFDVVVNIIGIVACFI